MPVPIDLAPTVSTLPIENQKLFPLKSPESMGIENLRVTLLNPSGVYYADQTVSGTVSFQASKQYKSDGVFVHFIGMAEVHWSERHTTGYILNFKFPCSYSARILHVYTCSQELRLRNW